MNELLRMRGRDHRRNSAAGANANRRASLRAAMLDMNLNGDKTTSVADALSARDVPFFFTTGYSGRDMRDGYRDRPLLIKPFRFEKLTEIFTELFPR